MANIFLISDTHFGHGALLRFTLKDGTPMRAFDSTDAMDEYIIEQWNSVVRPQDHVYHLGDVAMKWRNIATVGRCNGHKRLVRGNHDIFPTKKYLPFFEEIYGTRLFQQTVAGVREGLLLSHIPVHPESLKPNWVNVHGHAHNNVSKDHFGPKYFNASIEMMNYLPIELSVLWQRIKEGK